MLKKDFQNNFRLLGIGSHKESSNFEKNFQNSNFDRDTLRIDPSKIKKISKNFKGGYF